MNVKSQGVRCMGKSIDKVKLIINADDLGANAEVNDAIFKMMSKGNVTSSSMICNGPTFEDAAKRSSAYPDCSFGAHLYLTEWQPMTNHPSFDIIKQENGRFNFRVGDVKHSAKFLNGVYIEWSAQIRKILDYGIKLSHLDSHHEIHTMPSLFIPLKGIQKRFGIRKLRITRNMYPDDRPPATKLLLYKKALWVHGIKYIYKSKTTNRHCEFDTFMDMAKKGQIDRELIELMIHPGNPNFVEENKMMECDWRSQLPFDVELMSYNDL
jgi:predicted glycoside hydrolase/deacetylase ChbG (UPF0249 family)